MGMKMAEAGASLNTPIRSGTVRKAIRMGTITQAKLACTIQKEPQDHLVFVAGK